MKVNEEQIIKAIETLEMHPKKHETFIQLLDEKHPALSYFIFQVDQNLLLAAELDEWYSIGAILAYAMHSNEVNLPDDEDTDRLEVIEEKNWTTFEGQKGKLRDRLTVFFEGYEEEDLLAFVEDMITDDEESNLSSVAKEFIFIKGKTVIDYCIGAD